VAEIEKNVSSLTAVLVLANGTLPGISVGTHCALSSLTDILPDTMAYNIAFMLTNVSNPLYQNFSADTLPDVLKDIPQFLLNNPIPLQRTYLRLKRDQNMKKGKGDLCREVKAGEEGAMGMLVDLFDWLDGLEPQPMTDGYRNIKPMIADTYEKHSAVSSSTCLHLA